MKNNRQNLKSLYARLACCLACSLVLILGGAAGSFPAQTASGPQEAQNQDAGKKEPEKKASQASTPATGAANQADGFKWGPYTGHSQVEIGYRWVSDTAGNKDMYRSLINLGEGPKLLHSSLSMRADYGTGRLFDSLNLSLDSWGGEPYSTMRLDFGRTGAYEFRADYRHLNYFNFVPTWADPLLSKGTVFNQHGLDVSYRTLDIQLKLFPTHKLQPYVAYSRSTGYGPGFTTYSLTGNEFLLNQQWHYASDEYRGGVQLSLPRLALTLEQGYRFLKNDTGVTEDGAPQGNNPVPFIGNSIILNTLDRGYHDRTTLPVTKALLKFTPFENLTVTGRYVYTMSDQESNLAEIDTGSFVSLENRLIYTASSDAFNSRSKQPNHNGSFLVEYSPLAHLTVLDAFETRNFHVTGDALLASIFFNASSLAGPFGGTRDVHITDLQGSLLALDRLRNQAEVEYDLGHGFQVRAGHRYTHAETTLQSSDNGDTESQTAGYSQQTGIVGVGFTRARWLTLGLNYENNSTDRALTRTDLLDYDQFKFDWSVRPFKTVNLNGRVAFLSNTNGQSDIDFKSHNRNYTVALNYEPSERFILSLDYSRTNILSDIAILLPQTLQLDRSLFDERGNGIGAVMSLGIYHGIKADFGYRGILNLGSYPLNYHQPFASLTLPLGHRLALKPSWQYFGYHEKAGSTLQDNRTHLVTFAIAYQH
jgi:hypothetical protein